MDNRLYFSASTNLKSLLGKGLVTDKISAIFELVKNSYDADANCVRIKFIGDEIHTIIIEDDGLGMSLEDIENKWMVVGTNSKKDMLFSKKYSRPLNGDKGIGRFSVDCIGSKLGLKSVSDEKKERVIADFDWDLFENEYGKLESIMIPYSIDENVDEKSGVVLTISGLREIWDDNNVRHLIRNLRQFRSPFAIEDDFKIIIDAPQFGYNEYEIEAEKLEDISSLWVNIECNAVNPDVVYLTVTKDGIEYEETIKNLYNIGRLKARIYFFNQGDKIRFKNRFSIRVREFGNIRLYRDEFRIHPYGDPQDDWLDIDRRHAQGFSRTFSSRDLIGYIQTYKKDNVGLIPLTNRQGLIDNDDLKKLKQFIIFYGISTLERYYFNKFKKGKDETVEKTNIEIKASTQVLLQMVEEVAKNNEQLAKNMKLQVNALKKNHEVQLKYIKDQDELTKVYSRIAQSEVLLNKVIHQSLIDLKKGTDNLEILIKKDVFANNPIEKEFLNVAYSHVSKSKECLLTVRDDVVKKRKKQKIILKTEISKILDTYDAELKKYNIKLLKTLEADGSYFMDKSDLRAIVNNLLSNSVKSLRESKDEDKVISVRLTETNRFYMIFVEDNGIGIDPLIREKIFTPYFTTTEKYGGFGLGLSIIDDMLREYNSTLELVDNERKGACFVIKLKR